MRFNFKFVEKFVKTDKNLRNLLIFFEINWMFVKTLSKYGRKFVYKLQTFVVNRWKFVEIIWNFQKLFKISQDSINDPNITCSKYNKFCIHSLGLSYFEFLRVPFVMANQIRNNHFFVTGYRLNILSLIAYR